MGTEVTDSGNSSNQSKDYKSILADHLGKAMATIMIAGASTYFGIQYQNSEKTIETSNSQTIHQSIDRQIDQSSEKPKDKNSNSKKEYLVKIHSKLKVIEKLLGGHRMGPEKFFTQSPSGEKLLIIYRSSEKMNLKIGDLIEVSGIENMSPMYKEKVIVVDANESGSYLKKL